MKLGRLFGWGKGPEIKEDHLAEWRVPPRCGADILELDKHDKLQELRRKAAPKSRLARGSLTLENLDSQDTQTEEAKLLEQLDNVDWLLSSIRQDDEAPPMPRRMAEGTDTFVRAAPAELEDGEDELELTMDDLLELDES